MIFMNMFNLFILVAKAFAVPSSNQVATFPIYGKVLKCIHTSEDANLTQGGCDLIRNTGLTNLEFFRLLPAFYRIESI
ncbi:hypothetical protein F5B17DRAFT_411815 [Nemania serpens]|nr:hypothetical protein F5B17DRAFT_411815 [Nemania serpens]